MNIRLSRSPIPHLFLIAIVLCFGREEVGAQVAFEKREGELRISVDGKDFASYVWNDKGTTRPYFKSVKVAGGEVQITRNHPPAEGDLDDHETYHPGIWWGFGDVGGNDYWRMKAMILGGEFVEGPSGGDQRGSFSVRNRLLKNGSSDALFCKQVCRYTIEKRGAGILMICESTFTREDGDFWLGDQEEMGLGIRVATPIAIKSGKGGRIVDSEGRTDLKEIRTNQSDWCNYSGPIAGGHGGILLMNDPENFRRPWWHAVDNGLLIANPLGESELSGNGKKRENVLVKKGQPFRLRYGALIHMHDVEEAFDAAAAYKDFLSVLPSLKPTESVAIDPKELPVVADGFEVNVFAHEPMVYKPTSLCFDEKGRLMLGHGPQYPRNELKTPADSVVIVEDTDGDGRADASKVFATGFNSIQGLAWKGNDLYVANAPELTVVRDLDGDDEADEYVIIYTDLGNREHALHGLNWGPDGRLYMSKGNSKGHNQPETKGFVAPKPFRDLWDVVHPNGAPDAYPPKTFAKDTYKKSYHHWSDDWGREGGVLRCDPLGANLEIVSRGMRNPWDMAMDDGFNYLATDNDQDQGDRIIMPFYGSHFGWGHSYSSHWTGDDHLPTVPVSGPLFPGSGAGVIYYTHKQFPEEYRDVFFVNDWLYGTYVYRPEWQGALMQPAGGRWRQFARRGEGKMHYRPTDLEFAPDGSIFVCGWGSDYHYDPGSEGSWIFRIRAENAPMSQPAFKATVEMSAAELIDQLGAEVIPVRRVNAQDELVRRGESVRDELVRSIESGKLSSGQETWAIWALGRGGKESDGFLVEVLEPENRFSLNLRLQALRILATQSRQKADTLPDMVIACLKEAEPRIRFEAVQAIWQAKAKSQVSALIDVLATENDRITFYSAWRALQELGDTLVAAKSAWR